MAPAPVPGQNWYHPGWLFGGGIPGELPTGNWMNTDSGSAMPLNPMPDTTYDGQLNRSVIEVWGDPYNFFVTGPPFVSPADATVSSTAISIAHQSVDSYTYESYSKLINGATGAWIPAGEYVAPALSPGIGIPIPFPNAAPENAPIRWPGRPVPNTFADAVGDPVTQPSENPLTRPDLAPTPPVRVPMPFPGGAPVVLVPPTVRPSPGGSPVAPGIPSVVVSPAPGGGLSPPVILPPGNPTRREPPPPGTRERKVHLRNSSGVLVAVNVFTETLDFIDSLYAGIKPLLPQGACSNHDYACKLEMLYEHWDDPRFDAALFVESFVNNQFEDWAFGQLGQGAAGASRGIGVTSGLGRATQSGGSVFGELDGADDLENPLPQLDYDPETGQWSLTWLGWSTPSVGG